MLFYFDNRYRHWACWSNMMTRIQFLLIWIYMRIGLVSEKCRNFRNLSMRQMQTPYGKVQWPFTFLHKSVSTLHQRASVSSILYASVAFGGESRKIYGGRWKVTEAFHEVALGWRWCITFPQWVDAYMTSKLDTSRQILTSDVNFWCCNFTFLTFSNFLTFLMIHVKFWRLTTIFDVVIWHDLSNSLTFNIRFWWSTSNFDVCKLTRIMQSLNNIVKCYRQSSPYQTETFQIET